MLSRLVPRKKIFVSRRIQGQLVLRLGTYWILYHFALWHGLFAYHFVQQRMSGAVSPISFEEMYGDFALRYYPIAMCALAMLPVFLIDLVRLSHRIAGPLVRFRNSLRDMTADAEVQRIRLRRGDLLNELEDSFNAYIDVYERHRQERLTTDTMSPRDAQRIEGLMSSEHENAETATTGA